MNDMENVLNKSLVVYWWNMGRKQLDFKGSYRDYLKKTGIKYSRIHSGYRFRISTSSDDVRLDCNNTDFVQAVNQSIVLFLTLMGDRALVIGNRIDKKVNVS